LSLFEVENFKPYPRITITLELFQILCIQRRNLGPGVQLGFDFYITGINTDSLYPAGNEPAMCFSSAKASIGIPIEIDTISNPIFNSFAIIVACTVGDSILQNLMHHVCQYYNLPLLL